MPNIRPDKKMITIVCDGCGNSVTVRAYYDYTPKFCSVRCANKAHNQKRKHPSEICIIEGCEKPNHIGGLCQMHHWRKKHHGDVNHYIYQKHCNVDGCERPHEKGGYCSLHYQRMRRTGTTDAPKKLIDPKRYRQKKLPNHPLAGKDGRVFVHRANLYDEIGAGSFPCHWCEKLVHWDKSYPEHDDALIVDHLDHDRHNNNASNLVPSCNGCNSKRRRNP